MSSKKRRYIAGLAAAVFLLDSAFLRTDSFAGQMGGFDVEVGDGSYTWSEEQWDSEYSQQWNNEYWEYQQWNQGENMQQDWNGTEENTQQNWGSSGENMQQNWNETGESVQQNWNSAQGNTQQNWNGTGENTQQNWGSAEENIQQNWSSTGENIQQNWYGTEGTAGQNWNNTTGSFQYDRDHPSGNMNQNGNQQYLGNAGQIYASPTATPKLILTPIPQQTPESTITPIPSQTSKPSQTPKPSQTSDPFPSLSQTIDSNTIKSHFFKHFLFEQSTPQKTQHLPDVPVDFLHQEQIQEGDCPSITLCSEGSVQILSFRINDREGSWHWKENSIIADTPIGKGEYQIQLLVLTQGGKTAYMDPWKFSA